MINESLDCCSSCCEYAAEPAEFEWNVSLELSGFVQFPAISTDSSKTTQADNLAKTDLMASAINYMKSLLHLEE
ncbi:hypothetical protein [Neorickettsia sp. 179522]|uniref:hypothetical protein n=1 Tax=Neorickettsia sp. 179522 TaxID=1714371 RepID=UPI000A9DC984|nr:hypothetical protein [Neorickettsia sp. 179522]